MKKRYNGPQIVAKLRQADVLIGQGKTVPEICKEIEVSQQTYYRWPWANLASASRSNLTICFGLWYFLFIRVSFL